MMRVRFVSLVTALAVLLVATAAGIAAEKTKVVIWNWSQEQKEFYDTMVAQFEAENPDIDIEWHTYVQQQYRENLPLAFRSNSSPDIFWMAPEDNPRVMMDAGWLAPIEEYVDESFLAQYDDGYLIEGACKFDGELYTVPFYDRSVKLNGLMFWNKDVFENAGLDPEKPPKTWSEFRSVLKTITEKGNGRVYGLVLSGKPASEVHRILNGLLPTASPASGDIRGGHPGFDERTGEFVADDQDHMDVVELLRAIRDDGSIFPGWSSMDKTTARAMFAQGRAGIYFDGEWMPNTWKSMGYEDLNYGIAPAPVPDSGRRAYVYMGVQHGDVFVSSQTKDMEKTMRVYRWIHSPEFHTAYMKAGFDVVYNKQLDTASLIDNPARKAILEIAQEIVRTYPVPSARNSDAGRVLWPNTGIQIEEIVAADLNGDADYLTEIRAWNDKMSKMLEENIQKARSEGADVTIDDFIFADWDPMKDYVPSE